MIRSISNLFCRNDRRLRSHSLALAATTSLVGLVSLTGPALAQNPSNFVGPPGFKISLAFYNADAADILRAFALQAGVSIAVSPSVKGRIISIRLKGVRPLEALHLITQAAGVEYRKVDNAFVIGSVEELKKTQSDNQSLVYTLKQVPGAAAKSLIESVLPYVAVQTTPNSPAIVLVGSKNDLQEAQRLLDAADVPAPPVSDVISPAHVSADFLADIGRKTISGLTVEVKEKTLIATGPADAVERFKKQVAVLDIAEGVVLSTEIYHIKYSSAAALTTMLTSALPALQVIPSAEPYAPAAARFLPLTGGSLGSGFATGAAASTTTGVAIGPGTGQGNNAVPVGKSRYLILTGTDTVVGQALKLLRSVDVAPSQVVIEARIVDIAKSGSLDFGVEWGSLQTQNNGGSGGSGGSGGGSSSSTTQTFNQGTTQNAIRELNVPDNFKFGRYRRSPLDFAAQLQFLETRGLSKTLATPRISAIDNEDANIFIGEVRRFQVAAIASPTIGTAFTVQEVPVGVALLVRPRINDGDITIKVHPVVSTLLSQDANGLPQTASREADTTMRVRDGETVVIGGLIRDDEIRSLQQVPLLGDIPLFGELFRRRLKSKQRSEVVIFLTIHQLHEGDPLSPADAKQLAPFNAKGKEKP